MRPSLELKNFLPLETMLDNIPPTLAMSLGRFSKVGSTMCQAQCLHVSAAGGGVTEGHSATLFSFVHTLKYTPLATVNVTLFGHGFYAKTIKLR